MIPQKYKNIMNEICRRQHKSRDEALEILITLEDETRHKFHQYDFGTEHTYYYSALGKINQYYKKINEYRGAQYGSK